MLWQHVLVYFCGKQSEGGPTGLWKWGGTPLQQEHQQRARKGQLGKNLASTPLSWFSLLWALQYSLRWPKSFPGFCLQNWAEPLCDAAAVPPNRWEGSIIEEIIPHGGPPPRPRWNSHSIRANIPRGIRWWMRDSFVWFCYCPHNHSFSFLFLPGRIALNLRNRWNRPLI